MAESDPRYWRMVVKADSAPGFRPDGEDRGGKTLAEGRFKGLRSRKDYDAERVRPDGGEVRTLERILGVLSENSGYEILRFWRLLLGYFGLDVVRGRAFPRACFTRTVLPHPR
jgi:hypothetical protein